MMESPNPIFGFWVFPPNGREEEGKAKTEKAKESENGDTYIHRKERGL